MSTIRDIAKVSGVSYPTVSHVINKTRPVSSKTQKKVFAAIDQLGYIPNAVARGLSRKRMNTIGVVAAFPLNSLFDDNCHGKIIETALLALPLYDQSGMLHFAQRLPERPERISLYCDGRCDGLVIIGQPTDCEFVAALSARSFPFVCVTEAWETSGVPYFDVDQPGMTQALTKVLLELGHRKFAVLCGNSESVSVAQRAEGCRRAFQQWEISPKDTTFLPGTYSDVSGYNSARDLFTVVPKEDRPTAIICFSDYIAHGALLALSELGVRCPEDVSIVGIDDAIAPSPNYTPLTTMRLPLKELGKGAINLLLGIINSEQDLSLQNNLPAELIIRPSIAPPRSI